LLLGFVTLHQIDDGNVADDDDGMMPKDAAADEE
jgi:hypothetical protein